MIFLDDAFVYESTPEAQVMRRTFHRATPVVDDGGPVTYPKDCPWAAIHGGYEGTINWRRLNNDAAVSHGRGAARDRERQPWSISNTWNK